jgi:hypothetical protein
MDLVDPAQPNNGATMRCEHLARPATLLTESVGNHTPVLVRSVGAG